MDEDQLYFHPADPPSPKRPSDAEMIMARLARLPTQEDLWRAVLMGDARWSMLHASARAPVAVVIGGRRALRFGLFTVATRTMNL